ncbi:hypothetical protein [Krasilnikovia sp. MM14-A1004]|uniref:hypothetical protein n=1 Tax=Krasilnikovia sp. MM14-A1004 TaxID=3373541 RepID=UPI00399C78CB
MHDQVLGLLDQHLAELHALRSELARQRTVAPGERWQVAAATAGSARRYARELTLVLGGDDDIDDDRQRHTAATS